MEGARAGLGWGDCVTPSPRPPVMSNGFTRLPSAVLACIPFLEMDDLLPLFITCKQILAHADTTVRTHWTRLLKAQCWRRMPRTVVCVSRVTTLVFP